MSSAIWKLERVTLRGRPAPRLAEVSLELGPGVTAVLGHSGAGKTSLLNLLVGFEEPDAGSVRFVMPSPPLPLSPSPPLPSMPGGAPERQSRLPLFWLPSDGGLWPHLTVGEHLSAVLPGGGTGPKIAEFLEAFDLQDKIGSFPDQLSQGERTRLALVRAVASDAEVLVLDEPLVHLDPAGSREAWEVLRKYWERSRRTAVVFSTHSPEVVLREAERVVCLSEGRVVYSGSVAQLYHDPPTASLAWCLGPANWVTDEDPPAWLSGHTPGRRCYRPEELTVTAVTSSPLIVHAAVFSGSFGELEIRDERSGTSQRVFHRPAADVFHPGQRVWVTVAGANCLPFSKSRVEVLAESTCEVATARTDRSGGRP